MDLSPEDRRKWSLFLYGSPAGAESLSNAHGTGATASERFPNFKSSQASNYGGRLQYSPHPNLALALDLWRNRSDQQPIPGQGKKFDQTLWNLSPSIQGRYPMGPVTPYIGGGPVATRNLQCDNLGCSAPSMDIGAQFYGGLEAALTDRLKAMGELRYHTTDLTPMDQQGSWRGKHDNLSAIIGLGYTW